MSKLTPAIQFFGVGPQRTASSWLYRVLSSHPQIVFPDNVKETMFFDKRFDKGMKWYLWHFRKATVDSITGEIAPTYFECGKAAERMSEHFPKAKIIINIRNPIEQSYSLFRHHCSKGRVNSDFFEAAETVPSILNAAHYSKHIATWERLFPGNIDYVFQDDIKDSPQYVIESVCDFLEISRFSLPKFADSIVNVAETPRSPTLAKLFSTTATKLRDFRLYWLVDVGKKLGLKAAYQGGRSVKEIDDECFNFLLRHFEQDIDWIETKFDRDFSDWRVNRTISN